MGVNRGPVGAPNNRRGWTEPGHLQAGDHIKVGDTWGRLVAIEGDDPRFLVLVVPASALIHAVRCDDERDENGRRPCPMDGTIHDRKGRYCSDDCEAEARSKLLATRDDARRWVLADWVA